MSRQSGVSRFVDHAQRLIDPESVAISPKTVADLLTAIPSDPTYLELLVVKDVLARILTRALRCHVCSNCAVLPQLMDFLHAGASAHSMVAAIEVTASSLAPCGPRRSESAAHPAVLRALRVIAAHFGDASLTFERIATEAGLSRWHLHRLFSQNVGLGFRGYLHRVRTAAARRLLKDQSITVKEVAFRVGYRSTSQLDRNFKATTGMTPVAYRKALDRGRRTKRQQIAKTAY